MISLGLEEQQVHASLGPQASLAPPGAPHRPYVRLGVASCDAFLLLTVSIALQNELDNTRALLSQKGEFSEALGSP